MPGIVGTIEGLYIAHAAGAPAVAVSAVQAIPQKGLAGDRYLLGTGYYSNHPGWGANVTLIQSEAIAAINAGHGTNLTADLLRRNIVTSGIHLESLIGRQFRCDEAILRGTKVFPPCLHLANLVGNRDILKYLAHCGGIGADVVTGGTIEVASNIELIE
jgi:MOSC domain-containing protein YiiM